MSFFLFLIFVVSALAGSPRKAECGSMTILISDTGTRVWVDGGMYDFAPYGPLAKDDSEKPWTPWLQQRYDRCLATNPDPDEIIAEALLAISSGEVVPDPNCLVQLDSAIQSALLAGVPADPAIYTEGARLCGATDAWFAAFNRTVCPAIVDTLCLEGTRCDEAQICVFRRQQ